MYYLNCPEGQGAAVQVSFLLGAGDLSAPEGPRGHSENILEPFSRASEAWWAYLCREETDPLMG